MRQTDPSPSETARPATFQSRGVAPPFTTPLLAGARIRQSERSGLDVLLPNPSGRRGLCIVAWTGIRAFCTPTVHDTVLFRRLQQVPRIDPAAVRQAAQDTAREGLAGREAIDAASRAADSDHAARLAMQFLLLAGLVEQLEPAAYAASTLTDRTPSFDRRADLVLRRVAPSFGCDAARLRTGLGALGDTFAPVGPGWETAGQATNRRDSAAARIPLLLARVAEAKTELSGWLEDDPAHDVFGLGRSVASAMQAACEAATAVLTRSRAALADPVALMKRWLAQPADALAQASRCDWLLDGWEPVTLLWKTAASTASRRAAVLEMAQSLPVLPREAAAWTGLPAQPDAMDEGLRVVSQNDTWRRAAAALALIRRNESLRALAL